jgi:hypothetical protein
MNKRIKIHLLPRVENLSDQEDRVLNLGPDFDKYANSINEYIHQAKVPLLIEHNLDGGSYGTIVDSYSNEDGLFAIAEVPDPSVLEGKRFVSPRIRWNHRDLQGKVWPAALLETSLVSVPRFHIGQEEIESINSNALESKEATTETKFSEINLEGKMLPIEVLEEETTTGEITMTPELEAQIKEMVAGMIAELTKPAEKVESKVEETTETVAAEELPAEEDAAIATEDAEAAAEVDAEMSEDAVEEINLEEVEDMEPETLASRISKMSAENKDKLLMDVVTALSNYKKETVMSAIKADLKNRNLPETKAVEFYKVFKADKGAYETTMSAISNAPVTAKKAPSAIVRPTRTTPVAESTMSGVNQDPIVRALELQKAGKGTFADNLAKLTGK